MPATASTTALPAGVRVINSTASRVGPLLELVGPDVVATHPGDGDLSVCLTPFARTSVIILDHAATAYKHVSYEANDNLHAFPVSLADIGSLWAQHGFAALRLFVELDRYRAWGPQGPLPDSPIAGRLATIRTALQP